jgi:asparagine synthase (glutamine-hydrolysing)
MSGICGLLNFASPDDCLRKMDAALAHWGPDGNGLWHDEQCGLGQRLLFNTPEALHVRLPRWVEDAHIAFTADRNSKYGIPGFKVWCDG